MAKVSTVLSNMKKSNGYTNSVRSSASVEEKKKRSPSLQKTLDSMKKSTAPVRGTGSAQPTDQLDDTQRIKAKMDALKSPYGYARDAESADYIEAGRAAMQSEAPSMKEGGFLVTRPDKSADIRGFMNDDELNEYLYRYGKEGKESADAFLASMEEQLKSLRAEKSVQNATEFAQQHPGRAYASSVVNNLLGTFPAALYTAEQYLKREEIDPYAEEYMLSRIGQAQRQESIERMKDATDSGFLREAIDIGANVVGSSLDNVTRTLLFGPAGSAIMATGAAAEGVRNASERGYSKGQALAVGSVAGALEYLTEKAGFERVVGALEGGEGAIRTLVKSFIPEALEEGASSFGNAVADTLIGADRSELMELVEWYKGEGNDDKTALTLALRDTALSIGEEMLIGGLSGGLIGGGAAMIGNASRNAAYRQAGKDITSAGNRSAIMDLAMSLEESSPARQAASKMDSEKASNRDIGRLYYDTQRGIYDDAIRARMAELGISDEEAEITAMAINKVLEGEDLSRKEKKAYRASSPAQQIVSEFEQEGDPAEWVQRLDRTRSTVAGIRREVWSGESLADIKGAEPTETLDNEIKTQDIPEEAVDVLRQIYEAEGSPADARQLVSDFRLAYYAGRNGVDAETINLSDSKISKAAYSAGVAAADKAEGSSFKTGANVQYTAATLNRAAVQVAIAQTGKSRSKDVAKAKTYLKQQIAIIGSFAKKYDRRVIFENSIDMKGKDGKVRKSAANAYLDEKGDIHIALDSTDQLYTAYAIHELVHDIKRRSEMDYDIIKEYVLDALKKNGQDFESLVKKQMDKFGYSREVAEEEVIANTVPAILSDEETIRQMAQTNRGLLERIGEWIRDFISHLEKAFNRLSKSESFEQMEALKGDIESLRKIRDALFEALEDTKDSSSVIEDGGVVENESGEPVAFSDGNGGIKLSQKTYEESGRDVLKAYLYDQVEKGEFRVEDADDMLAQLDFYHDKLKEIGKRYDDYSKWAWCEVKVDDDGNPILSVVKENGDYVMNLDFSLVCKKRRALDAVFSDMIKRGIINDYNLGQEQIVQINDIIREHGLETACAICFVESKRFRQAKVADDFVKIYNDIVKGMAKNGQKIDYFNFGGNETLSRVSDGIDKLPDTDIDLSKARKIVDDGDRTGKTRDVRYAVAKHLLENPRDRKLLDRGDFVNSDGFFEGKKLKPEILKLYNRKKGSGGPKASFGDVQYLNDVIKNGSFRADKAYSVGGVRIQSFSDYIPALAFDYMQMVGDLAAKKLPAHSYTKEELFVRQFGLTGVKINMSLVPKVVKGYPAGLGRDGYAWAGESFDFDTAIEIQSDPEYGKNCGTICVGVSDEHIDKLLDDDRIRMVIPYHKSSLNPIVAKMNKIDQFKDYTRVQSTRYSNGKKLGKAEAAKEPNFNELLREYNDPKAAANAYLDWCNEHGYLPKFDRWAGRENYYKLLTDFALYDEAGNYQPQEAVHFTFPTESSAFGGMMSLIERGLEEHQGNVDKISAERSKIVDEIQERLEKKGQRFSMKDNYDETDPHDREMRINGLRNEIEELEDSLMFDDDELASRKFTKLNGELERLLSIERNASVKTSPTEILRNLDVYRPNDLISLAEQIAPNWDEVEELDSSEIREGIREIIEGMELSPLEMQSKRFGWYVIPAEQLRRDVKFSLKDDPELVNDVLSAYPEMGKVLSSLETQEATAAGRKMTDAQINRYVRRWLKANEIKADYDAEALTKDMSALFRDFYKSKKMTAEEFAASGAEIMRTALEKARSFNSEAYEADSDIRSFLRSRKIKLTDVQKQDVESVFDSVGAYKKAGRGKFRVSDDGEALDVLWQSLSERRSDLFPADVAEGGMPVELMAAAHALSKENYYFDAFGRNLDEASLESFLTVVSDLTENPTIRRNVREMRAYGEKQYRAAEKEASKKRIAERKKLSEEYNTLVRMVEGRARAEEKGKAAEKFEKQKAILKEKYRNLSDKRKQDLAIQRELFRERTLKKDAARKDREKKAKYRKRIEKNLNEIATWLMSPTDKKHVPEALRTITASFIESIDLYGDRKASERWQSRLRKLHDYMVRADSVTMENEAAAYFNIDEAFLDELKQFLDLNEDASSVWDMDAEQLKSLDYLIGVLKNAIKTVNSILIDGKWQAISELAEATLEKAEAKGPKRQNRLQLSTIGKLVTTENLKPWYFFKGLADKSMTKLYNGLRDAQDKIMFGTAQARRYYRSVYRKYHAKDWLNDNKDNRLKLTTSKGQKIELTRDLALSVYATAKREAANASTTGAAHLSVGGIILNTPQEVKDGKKTRYIENAQRHPISDADLEKILNWLTPEQKSFADDLVRYMSEDLSALGNETSVKLSGYKKFTERYYFPYKVSSDYRKTDPGKASSDDSNRWKNWGSAKSTIKGANAPIVLENFTKVFGDHTNEMLNYAHLAIAQENFIRVYNYKGSATEDRTMNSVKSALSTAYGVATKEYIDILLRDLGGGFVRDPRENGVLASRYKKAKVLGSLSVAIQQPSSIVRAVALMSPKYFVGKPRKGSFEEAMQYAGTAMAKRIGGFDTGLSHGLSSYITEVEPEGLGNKAKALFSKDSKYRDDLLGWLPGKMDEITWGAIWEACKRETAENTGLSGEELLKATGSRFNDVIEATQVYDSTLSRSSIMRSKSGLVQMVTAFMAEPTVTINMLMDSAAHARDKNYEGRVPFARAMSAFVGSVVLNSLLKGIVYAMRDDDDDQSYFEKYTESVVNSLIGDPIFKYGYVTGDLSPLTMIPYIRDVVSIFQGYDVERTDMGLITDLRDAAKIFLDDDQNWRTRITSLAGAVSNICGVPVQNVYRDMEAVFRTFKQHVIGGDSKEDTDLNGLIRSIENGLGINHSITAYAEDLAKAEYGSKRASKAVAKIDAEYRLKVEKKIKDGKKKAEAEEEVQSSIKSSCTEVFKPLYLEAKTAREKTAIIDLAKSIKVGGKQLYKDYDFSRYWKEE